MSSGENMPSFYELRHNFMSKLTLDQKKAMRSAFMEANLEVARQLCGFIVNPYQTISSTSKRACAVAGIIDTILGIIDDGIKNQPLNV
jgi:hypothetical protein